MKELNKTKKLVFMAILAALSVVLKVAAIDITENFRIGLESTPLVLSGIWLGPVAGLLTGTVADLLGCLVKGYSINPIITVGAALVGFVTGIVWRLVPLKNRFLRVLISAEIGEFIASGIVKSFGMYVYFHTAPAVLALRIPVYIVYALIDAYAVWLIMKTGMTGEKREKKMNYSEAVEYIHSISWRGSRPGLERITELCEKMGNPQNGLKFIHIAGTNGKGSTSSMLSSVLLSEGYSVGLFTSPFVDTFNERIRLNGENISDEDLAEVTQYVKSFADGMADPPTEFELITAIGLEYYRRKKPDYVVFECGMGGRFDSTNVITTTVLSVVTGIDLDHTAILGDTVAKIAWEKAGIIKENVPVIAGECDSEALKVLSDEANRMNAPLYTVDYSLIDNIETTLGGTTFTFDNARYGLKLLGLYQTRNAALVISAVGILRKYGIVISEDALKNGLEKAEWSARFEILSETDPLIIYDGAHNPQGIRGACENIEEYLTGLSADGRIVLLMGVMADKDHGKMTEMLAPYVRRVFTVLPPNSRSLDERSLLAEFSERGIGGQSFGNIEEGVAGAAGYARREHIPLLCLGSLYMYHDVRTAVEKWCSLKGD